MVLTELFGNVFVGDIEAAKDLELLKARKITHIIVAGRGLECFHRGVPGFTYLEIDILDDCKDELLPNCPACFKFLRGCSKRGQNVLVHCLAGSSRSVSICMAWFMYDMKLEYDFLFPDVKALHPISCPNGLFESQLRLFEEFGYTFKGDTPAHRRYKLSRQKIPASASGVTASQANTNAISPLPTVQDSESNAQQDGKGEEGCDATSSTVKVKRKIRRPEKKKIVKVTADASAEVSSQQIDQEASGQVDASTPDAADNAEVECDPEEVFSDESVEEKSDPKMAYSCRQCRTHLFTDLNVLEHDEESYGGAEKNFGHQYSGQYTSIKTGVHERCHSVFVEPMDWMKMSGMAGKLHCQQCQNKIGAFSWHGLRCNCGCWQSPAFQIVLSKVDRMPVGSLCTRGTATCIYE